MKRAALVVVVIAWLAGCGAHVVKPAAWDQELLEQLPLPAQMLAAAPGGERVVRVGPGWFADVDPAAGLTFAGYRATPDQVIYSVVVRCSADDDQLLLLSLEPDETPLDVLASPSRRAELEAIVRRGGADAPIIDLSLRRAVAERRLGPPLPEPRHVYGVVANYPSHLQRDLARRVDAPRRAVMSAARPRVFLKHPPTSPPVGAPPARVGPLVLGPFDDIRVPTRIGLADVTSTDEESEASLVWAPTFVDYEVELGIVVGRHLDADTIAGMTDEALREAVAGVVLVSDTKARNPQVFEKIRADDRRPDAENPYRYGDAQLDNAVTIWDEESCQWWSYAASWGSYTSLGPFFRAGPASLGIAMLSARSYAAEVRRGHPVPDGREADTLYLRQLAATTEDPDYEDALIWTVPQVIRSIVEPGTALAFTGEPVTLEPGDVICMGTPGGTVLTSRPYRTFDLLEDILFFWSPRDWHDAFFADGSLYLHEGDRLLLWAEGLGIQLLTVREEREFNTEAQRTQRDTEQSEMD
ncbi:MAG: fumarylacetoacetate hydrolase family protein [Planctomycetota bacterium]